MIFSRMFSELRKLFGHLFTNRKKRKATRIIQVAPGVDDVTYDPGGEVIRKGTLGYVIATPDKDLPACFLLSPTCPTQYDLTRDAILFGLMAMNCDKTALVPMPLHEYCLVTEVLDAGYLKVLIGSSNIIIHNRNMMVI